MALPPNVLQQVQTYQMSELAFLVNSFVSIDLANKKFQNFQDLEANLGQTVTFDLAPRSSTVNSLIASFQASAQRVQSLTVDQQVSTSRAFNVQQFIYNVEDYMTRFGKTDVMEVGTVIEADINQTYIDHTYRFYGDGVTPINSFGQLAQMLALFRNYGAAKNDTRCILPDIIFPGIVNTGLNQFVPGRNEDLAKNWKLGDFSRCGFYESNLMPIHTAGTVGNSAQTLTVISTNDPTGANITQITCSGATASDVDALKNGDLAYISSPTTLRYLTFIGHKPSANQVQFRITADAEADGSGHVVLNIFPALVSVQNQNQNISRNIVSGMEIKVVPTHLVGVVMSGNPLYLAMPKMPDEVPYPTGNMNDPDSGASIRMYYGSLFGQNQRGIIHDQIWGKTMVDENAMRICIPLI